MVARKIKKLDDGLLLIRHLQNILIFTCNHVDTCEFFLHKMFARFVQDTYILRHMFLSEAYTLAKHFCYFLRMWFCVK